MISLQNEFEDSAALMENKALRRLAAIVTTLIAGGVICSPAERGGKEAFFISPSVFVAVNKGGKKTEKSQIKTHVM